MREIKFRAWDRDNKQMFNNVSTHEGVLWMYVDDLLEVYPDKDGDDLERLGWESSVEDMLYKENVIYMQYTGLKDKNGVEIYEGDILGYRNPNTRKLVCFGDFSYESEYTESGIGFYLKENNRIVSELRPTEFGEVIGNIYENPELLTDRSSNLAED